MATTNFRETLQSVVLKILIIFVAYSVCLTFWYMFYSLFIWLVICDSLNYFLLLTSWRTSWRINFMLNLYNWNTEVVPCFQIDTPWTSMTLWVY